MQLKHVPTVYAATTRCFPRTCYHTHTHKRTHTQAHIGMHIGMSMHICCPPSAPLHTSASVKLTILVHSTACLPQRNVYPLYYLPAALFPLLRSSVAWTHVVVQVQRYLPPWRRRRLRIVLVDSTMRVFCVPIIVLPLMVVHIVDCVCICVCVPGVLSAQLFASS